MKIFTEEFIDELAKRVARKLSEQSYRNQLFKENDSIMVVESGCGSTKITRKPKTKYYDYGCGSGRPSSYGGC